MGRSSKIEKKNEGKKEEISLIVMKCSSSIYSRVSSKSVSVCCKEKNSIILRTFKKERKNNKKRGNKSLCLWQHIDL
jgi:hypothetical protein